MIFAMRDNSSMTDSPEDNSEPSFERYDIAKLKSGLQRHLLLIAGTTLLFTLLASWFTYNFLTTYKADAVVIFQAENDPKNIVSGLTVADFTLATALDIIKLPANLQAVKSILGLPQSAKQIGTMFDIPTPRSESNLIHIVAQSSDPDMAINLANTLAEVAVKNSQDFSLKQLQEALRNYQNQLEVTRNRLTLQLRELETFKKDHQYFDMTAENSTLLREITEAKRNLLNAEITYNGMLVEYENIKREVENLPPSARMLGTTSLQTRIAALESALAEGKSKFAANNPKLKQLQEELAELRSKSGKNDNSTNDDNRGSGSNLGKENLDLELIRMQGRVRAAQKRKQDLAEKLENLEKLVSELPALQVAFSKLLQQKSLTEEQIAYLTKSIETLQLLTNSPKGSLELYQKAIESKPSRESIIVYLLPFAGLFFGFGSGLGLAFLMEVRDNKIRTAKQAYLDYNIPTWVVIPELPKLKTSETAARFRFFTRQIEERLEQYQNGQTPFSVALVSTQEGEGKTTLATQLAQYSAERGRSTLVIYMDPRVSEHFPATKQKGLAEVLNGKASISEIIQEGPFYSIRLLYEDSAMKELVRSKAMSELWSSLGKQFDWIIVDAPGIIADDYAINLAKNCQVTLYVIGSSQTSKGLIDEAMKELSSAGITPQGIILNRVLPVYIEDERILRQLKRRWHDTP